MVDFPDTSGDTSVCAVCRGSLFGSRYASVAAGVLQVFCSRACLAVGLRAQSAKKAAARHRWARRLTIGAILLGAGLTPHRWPLFRRPARVDRVSLAPSQTSQSMDDRVAPPALPPGWFGPEWPPTETTLLAALGRDAWVHPLAGPVRRMPVRDARVFGADRPGARAVECRNGHCGVDLGGELWGEHVRAAHDGVVDYVQRGANPDHGGRFVRISHHDGTVFTQYFHLAAIPRGLERGVPVKGGQVVGLLGDSGVKASQPHLHFSISVRPWPGGAERYMDPEPLVALWPLRVPVEGSEVGLVTILAPPGYPLGSALLHPGHWRKVAEGKKTQGKNKDGRKKGATADGAANVEPSESTDQNEPTADTATPAPSEEE